MASDRCYCRKLLTSGPPDMIAHRTLLLAALVFATAVPLVTASERPNVVLIMSDDQGYGDFGATGNKIIETPNIDAMAKRSASMSTFYVCPVCSPTRACLMTGRYNYRTRVIDTFLGRSMMEPAETTIAEVLSDAGYATGIFGKWHLGDSYPLRAIDQGFQESLIHKGGGLAQASDPLENKRRYTDAILFRNGEQIDSKGYCTDVYFDAALEFIEESTQDKKNFFVYLPTNAPHGPFHDAPKELLDHYMSKDLSALRFASDDGRKWNLDKGKLAAICAMITNIDQNVGRLFETLDRLKITHNTIVIYMVDNGPNSSRYVGPFRGSKTTVYEGGVRSPFWIQWHTRLEPGAASSVPVAHIDVMPTILDACDVDVPKNLQFDGRSFLPLLQRKEVDWSERVLAIQAHRGNQPFRFHNFMIRDSRWKLLHASGFGKESFSGAPAFELYDLQSDPGEQTNLVDSKRAVVDRLKDAYESWFEDVSHTRPDNYAPPRIQVGTAHESSTVLSRQDWRVEPAKKHGHWLIDVAEAGRYQVEAIFDRAVSPEELVISIGESDITSPLGKQSGSRIVTTIDLPAGETSLAAKAGNNGKSIPVYHLVVTKM